MKMKMLDEAEKAYCYARDVVKGRFPEGETSIAKSACWSYFYARDVLKGRYPEGEAAIAEDAYQSYCYASYVIKGRFPAGEAVIAKAANWSYEYALYVLYNRFPAGERTIAKSAEWSFLYAVYVLHSSFSEGEVAIAKDARLASEYSAFLDSMALLRSFLNEKEEREFDETGAVTVNKAFTVPLAGTIKTSCGSFCVAFEDKSLPAGDLLLAKILLLKAAPDRLLKEIPSS